MLAFPSAPSSTPSNSKTISEDTETPPDGCLCFWLSTLRSLQCTGREIAAAFLCPWRWPGPTPSQAHTVPVGTRSSTDLYLRPRPWPAWPRHVPGEGYPTARPPGAVPILTAVAFFPELSTGCSCPDCSRGRGAATPRGASQASARKPLKHSNSADTPLLDTQDPKGLQSS